MEKRKPLLKVDVVVDLMCPWCWIAKQRMDRAMESLSDRVQFEIRWIPYLLRPDILPRAGVLGLPWSKSEMRRARVAGKIVDLDLTFESPVTPRMLASHALVRLAGEVSVDSHKCSEFLSEPSSSTQSLVVESIFEAYLTEGKSLTEADLVAIATKVGMDGEKARSYITNVANLKKVVYTALNWEYRGVTGVPCFYVNGQRMFFGAQDEEVFKRLFFLAAHRVTTAQRVCAT